MHASTDENGGGVPLGKEAEAVDIVEDCRLALARNPLDAKIWCELAHALRFRGAIGEARKAADEAMRIDPDLHVAWFERGAILVAEGDVSHGMESYRKALQLNPAFAEAWNNLGSLLGTLGKRDEEISAYRRAISINPRLSLIWRNLGNALQDLERDEEALECYDQVLIDIPDETHTLCCRCVSLQKLGRLEDALKAWRRVVEVNPKFAPGYFSQGNILLALENPHEAIKSFKSALDLNPDFYEALNNLGNALQQLNRHEEAIEQYSQALNIRPDSLEILYNRGVSLQSLGRLIEALSAYEQVLAFNPIRVDALINQGNVLQQMGRNEEALGSYEKVIAINAELADAHYNRGNVLQELGRFDESMASYDCALLKKSDYVEAYYNRGNLLQMLARHTDAISSYDSAIGLNPSYAEAYYNRGISLHIENRIDEAEKSFRTTLELLPAHPYAYGAWIHQRQLLCDWRGIEDDAKNLLHQVIERKSVVHPFALISITDSPVVHRLCAEQHTADLTKAVRSLPIIGNRSLHTKIRLAYVSADFYQHATAVLMAGLFEHHDRTRFEVIGVSTGPDDKSDMRARLQSGFDKFIDVREKSDIVVAQWLRDNEIDIAIHLNGHCGNSRQKIFASQPAPIQVSYLGYPGTTGAPYIDYVIADKHVIRSVDHDYYSEKVVYLPDTYQVNDDRRGISGRLWTRVEANLPEEAFVFCCFNNNFKILPKVFDVWMRLLKQVQGSVLWLLEGNPIASRNLKYAAQERGVGPERIVFAPRLEITEHLARHQLANLFLDTLPYNAHTTASDALWAGLPFLTCKGETFAGRVGASLLHAIGLPELITNSLADYESLALNLATDQLRLSKLREKLFDNREKYPLFDTDLFRRHIESAYTTMWDRYKSGEAPITFSV